MDQVDRLHASAVAYREVLDQADELASRYHHGATPIDPAEEIGRRLPMLLATLSPAARAMIRQQVDDLDAVSCALVEVFGHPRLRLVSSS